MVVTGDNSWRLQHVLDPQRSPLLAPLRRAAKRILKPARPVATEKMLHRFHSLGELQAFFGPRGAQRFDDALDHVAGQRRTIKRPGQRRRQHSRAGHVLADDAIDDIVIDTAKAR